MTEQGYRGRVPRGQRRSHLQTRLSLIPLVAFIALAACTNTSASDVEMPGASSQEGDSALFCRGWAEARQTIIDTIAGEEDRLEWYDSAKALDLAMAGYDELAPPDIRSEWAIAYDAYTKLSDIRFTTGDATRAEHYTMVFGSPDAEPALSNALAAIAVIDEWSLTECGDFCSRWPELQRLVTADPGSFRFEGDPEMVTRKLIGVRNTVQAGYALVPDEIRVPWIRAADITIALLDMLEEYDGHLPDGDDGENTFIEWVGMHPERATTASEAAIETIGVWTANNCAAALASGGAPGSLRLRYWPYEHLPGRTVFAALLPPGVPFESMTSTDQYLGASCGELFESVAQLDEHLAGLTRQARESNRAVEDLIKEQWYWGETLRSLRQIGEYYETICGRIRNEGDLVLPGGRYDLFIGTYIGDPGSYDLYLGAPEYCAQVTVNIDGDTTVDVPELEKCDLPPQGDPDEIARRTPVPFEPGGTLSVELASPVAPDEFDGCWLGAALLPTGTTLNDIGRGETWPVGGFSTGLANTVWIEESLAPGVAIRSGRLPIVAVGPTGGMIGLNMQPDERSGVWDASLPAPTPLAAGVYDLRVFEECYTDGEDDGEENRRCGALLGIEVDGDTVVPMTDLGTCP